MIKNDERVGTLDLALIEPSITGDHIDNFRRGSAGVREALDSGASLIVLPELWVTGFARTRITDFLKRGGNHGIDAVRRLEAECRHRGADLVFGFPEPADAQGSAFYNALSIPGAARHRAYRKLMVYVDVEKNFRPAKDVAENLVAFSHVNGRNERVVVAVQLCADLRFPEIARAGGRLGASLILNCSQWRAKPRLNEGGPAYPDHWEWLLRARAIENQVYVAGCGAVGTAYAYDLLGKSAVYDPLGRRVEPADDMPIRGDAAAGRRFLFHLDMSLVGEAADPQAPHFIPWVEEMTPVIERVVADTRASLGEAARQPQADCVNGDIFLSYAAEDEALAKKLVEKANSRGLTVFFAPKSLQFGTDFGQDIRAALSASRELWLLMSPRAKGSEWVVTEWGAAWALSKLIIPILLRVSPSDLPDRLRTRHAADYHDADKLIDQAVARKQGLRADG